MWKVQSCIISCLKNHPAFFFFFYVIAVIAHQDMVVPLCLTELGYCADLISRGNHPGGRKHHLLINKNVSWRFQENDSAPRGMLKQKFW